MTEPTGRARLRRQSRRPILDSEVPYLERLGAELRRVREAAGLSRPVVARRAQVGTHTLAMIEWACRRTRRSTLERIVAATVPDPVRAGAIVEHLLKLGGPAVAEESPWVDRLDRRRVRRTRRNAEREAIAAELAPHIAEELVKQLRVRQLDKKRLYGHG